jgi:[acyl-carrier-protein] S-malonyltransferase
LMPVLAFLYPGQGAQKVGMGAELLAARPEVYERYLGEADAVSGLPVREHILEGPAETLMRTDVAQPALFALSLAITEVARERGLEPDFVAGHSLGEYTAAVAAGALSFEDGMRLVSLRGRLMHAAQTERPGTMAAIIGLTAERIGELCEEASEAGLVTPANYNTPSQIVVSGERAGVERAMELAREAGAAKVVPLQVGAAFHSALMEPAQRRMGEEMESVEFRDAGVPIASNARAAFVQRADDVRGALFEQIASPVRWVDCVQALQKAGVERYVELGPGRVLAGLVKGIIGADADIVSVDAPEKLDPLATAGTTSAT